MKPLRLLFLAAALLTCACTRRPVQPRFGLLAVDTLLSSPGGIACQVSYRFAPILNAAEAPALQAVEEANIGYFFELEGFTGSAAEAAEAALREIAAEYGTGIPAGSVGADYEISVTAEGAVADTLIVYTITRSSFTGGAHGMYGTTFHTYSLAGGYELSTADLFDAPARERLREAIRRKICEQYDAANDEELIAQGFFPEYIDVTENFCVLPDGILFLYNPYDIGCYALGPVEVTLSTEELEAVRRGA